MSSISLEGTVFSSSGGRGVTVVSYVQNIHPTFEKLLAATHLIAISARLFCKTPNLGYLENPAVPYSLYKESDFQEVETQRNTSL